MSKASGGYVRFRPPPISNEASSINKFVDLVQRTNDLKSRYVPRYAVSKTDTVSTNSTSWVSLDSLVVTLSVRAGNFVALYVEGEVWSPGLFPLADIGVYEVTDISTPINMVSSAGFTDTWVRRVSTPADPYGAAWPNGAWTVFPATPGIRSYYLRYRARTTASTVQFRNRVLFGALL